MKAWSAQNANWLRSVKRNLQQVSSINSTSNDQYGLICISFTVYAGNISKELCKRKTEAKTCLKQPVAIAGKRNPGVYITSARPPGMDTLFLWHLPSSLFLLQYIRCLYPCLRSMRLFTTLTWLTTALTSSRMSMSPGQCSARNTSGTSKRNLQRSPIASEDDTVPEE